MTTNNSSSNSNTNPMQLLHERKGTTKEENKMYNNYWSLLGYRENLMQEKPILARLVVHLNVTDCSGNKTSSQVRGRVTLACSHYMC